MVIHHHISFTQMPKLPCIMKMSLKKQSEIFKFITQDVHVHTFFFHFELSTNANQNENNI